MRRPASPRLFSACALILALTFGTGYGLGRGGLLAGGDNRRAAESGTLDEVWEIVEREYYDRSALDGRRMSYGAVDGLLKSLGDPYAALVPPTGGANGTGASGGTGTTLQLEAKPEARRADPVAAWLGRTAYIAMPAFGPGSAEALEKLVRSAVDARADAIVLDLRDNPGGYLDAAVSAAGLFLKDGIVLYQQNGDGTLRQHTVRPGSLGTELPLTVLVNGGTASAAEVLAAALQGHRRALLVGEPTYGKGSVQSVHRLGDGASLRLTVAHWLTPAREDVSGRGLTPDVYARGGAPSHGETPAESADPTLAAALARLRAGR